MLLGYFTVACYSALVNCSVFFFFCNSPYDMSFTFWIVLNIQRNEPFFCVLLLRLPSRPHVHKEIVSVEASYFALSYPKNIPLIYLNNNIIPWLKKIIWVIGVLRRTVVSDWRFDNLCGSHLQSQVVVLVSWKFKNPGEHIITAYLLKLSFYREFQSSLMEVISFAKFKRISW